MTTQPPRLPDGLERVRTTPVWDEESLPDGLLRAHRIADGIWGRLVVHRGAIDLTFEDDGTVQHLETGDAAAIPPARDHHVSVLGPVRFVVEFHRPPAATGAVLRERIAEQLTLALRAGDVRRVRVIRHVLAALDNATSAPAPEQDFSAAPTGVAGLGGGEGRRRRVGPARAIAVIEQEREELLQTAARLRDAGRTRDAADRTNDAQVVTHLLEVVTDGS